MTLPMQAGDVLPARLRFAQNVTCTLIPGLVAVLSILRSDVCVIATATGHHLEAQHLTRRDGGAEPRPRSRPPQRQPGGLSDSLRTNSGRLQIVEQVGMHSGARWRAVTSASTSSLADREEMGVRPNAGWHDPGRPHARHGSTIHGASDITLPMRCMPAMCYRC